MANERSSDETVFYQCPNDCEDTWFAQEVTTQSLRLLTESGEEMETHEYDFTPTGPVKCRKCDAEALVGKRTITTEVVITFDDEPGAESPGSP